MPTRTKEYPYSNVYPPMLREFVPPRIPLYAPNLRVQARLSGVQRRSLDGSLAQIEGTTPTGDTIIMDPGYLAIFLN